MRAQNPPKVRIFCKSLTEILIKVSLLHIVRSNFGLLLVKLSRMPDTMEEKNSTIFKDNLLHVGGREPEAAEF